MEQLINNMLANTQLPQAAPPVKKGEAAQKDGFQKLLEQKQADNPQAPRPEKADAPQKPQEPQDAQRVQEAGEEVPAAPKDGKVLEDQMTLAAMLMMQNPVVPVEQVLTPEVQAEAAVGEIAPLAAEALLAQVAEPQHAALEEEAQVPETLLEGGEQQAVDPALAEELPQTIEAPEAAQDTEGRTAETRVETGGAGDRGTEAADTEETPEFQGAETGAPVFEDVKAVPVKVGEAPRAAENAETENIGKQIGSKLIEITSVTGEAGGQRVTIDLDPANLGKLQIEVGLSKDGTLYVHVNAENSRTQNLLSRNSESLAAILGKYTQQEVRVEVPRQEESQRQDLYEQQQEQHRRHQQEQRRKQESSEDFLQQLRLGLVPLDGE